MTLRHYQVEAIKQLRVKATERPILVLPTGAGKTSVAAEMIRSTVAKGKRAIFLVHRTELVDQAAARLYQSGIHAGRILAGYREERLRPVQVASILSLVRRAHWPADLVIVDECAHVTKGNTWSKVLDRYESSSSCIVGMTACPLRLDGKGLGDIFGAIVEPAKARDLVAQGFLVSPTFFAPPIDLKGVRVRMGDYDLPQLEQRMSKLCGHIIKTWLRHARGLPTVCFAVNVAHSKQIVEAFRAAGVSAVHLDAHTPREVRRKLLRAVKAGEVEVVSNAMILGEGFDAPVLRCAILARPTKSLALYRQQVGRVMRPPGPAIVLDHAGNYNEHGSILDEIEWSLDAPARRVSTAERVRTCKECFAVLLPGVDACQECGTPVGSEARGMVTPGIAGEGELVLIDGRPVPMFGADTDVKRAKYAELLREATLRRRKIGWAQHRYHDLFGVWPNWSGKQKMEREFYRCFTPENHNDALTWTEIQTCPTCRRKEKWAPGGVIKGAAWSPT